MYSRENYHDEHYETLDPEAYRASVRFLKAFAGDRKRLLDFGAGNGSFMVAAKELGFAVTGIEYQSSAIESARRNTGERVLDWASAEAQKLRFDIIHLGDVFEHLPNPLETMTKLRGLLAEKGVFFIEGPLQNNLSVVRLAAASVKAAKRLVSRDQPGRSPPTHLILVDRTAQERFFRERMGMRVVQFRNYENGWPYKNRLPLRTLGGVAKRGIGELARLAHRLSDRFANRFAAIVEPPQ